MKPDDKPIGYWLKLLDRLIEQSFEAVLADHRLNRRHWQALNVLRGGGDLATGLDPFWRDTGPTADDVLAELTSRGWIAPHADGGHRLSPAGETAYASLAERVRRSRATIANGVTDEEYATVIRVLRRMVANLEPAQA